MCGLFGVVAHGDDSTDWRAVVDEGLELIHYRGPDGRGIETLKYPGDDLAVVLGHVRLSIIDVDGGRQPMADADTSIVLSYNGEIYNFQELRKTLQEKGHRFRGRSDTEVVLRAYAEWGEEAVAKFRGMFAFALWDGKRRRLLIARDRFGKKPLYYTWHSGHFLFASEIKCMLRAPGIAPSLNLDAVYDYLSYRYVPCPATLFRGIEKLDPGTFALLENGRLETRTYYTPPDRQALNGVRIDVDDPVAGFAVKLEEAVRIRMVSDVPFGAFLSGGLDSSAVVGLMTPHSCGPVKTFSVGFSEKEYSELSYARTIADHFGTDHHELVVSQDDLMEYVPRLVRFRDAPISEPSDVAIYLLSVEARKSVKMILTGEGSDEVLGGYPKHVFERFSGAFQLLPRAIRERIVEPLVTALPFRFRRIKTAIVNLGLGRPEDRMPRWFGALSPRERARLTDLADPVVAAGARPTRFDVGPGSSRLRQILYFDQTSWLPDNLLERGDRMTMAGSIEARMPFLDHELAEYVSRLPDRYRVRGFQTKWILRRAMERLVPRQILERPKVGFRVPVNVWFRGPLRDYLQDHLTGPDSLSAQFYRRDGLERVLREHIEGRQNHEKLLWTLLILEIWCREYRGCVSI